jgi:ferredoxin
MPSSSHVIIDVDDLQHLLHGLIARGFQPIAPTVRDGAIVYDTVSTLADLPIGWTDVQNGGTYRLQRRQDQALFGYTVGPHSWTRFLHPPALQLWQVQRREQEIHITPNQEVPPKYAFIGVRACELQAMAVQDRVFLHGPYVDPTYAARREQAFIIAVNCGQAGGTCFCVSMQTGPKATTGYDLALTEVLTASRQYFVVEISSDRAAELMSDVPHRQAHAEDIAQAAQIVAHTAEQMGRTLETTGIKELLYRNLEHPRWQEVATRCLSCANCTMVCPTCFCTTVEDVTDLTGEHAERWRKWDSCFTAEFSYIHGGSVRTSAAARYRHWLTHKLATWIDQFGTSGCVGCGRCITWCPVGIDITEEMRVIRQTDQAAVITVKERQDANT